LSQSTPLPPQPKPAELFERRVISLFPPHADGPAFGFFECETNELFQSARVRTNRTSDGRRRSRCQGQGAHDPSSSHKATSEDSLAESTLLKVLDFGQSSRLLNRARHVSQLCDVFSGDLLAAQLPPSLVGVYGKPEVSA
jgi:hypothetical protein